MVGERRSLSESGGLATADGLRSGAAVTFDVVEMRSEKFGRRGHSADSMAEPWLDLIRNYLLF